MLNFLEVKELTTNYYPYLRKLSKIKKCNI